MFKVGLDAGITFLTVGPSLGRLSPAAQAAVLAGLVLLFLVPLGLILWLSRYELHLVSRWNAAGLLMLRLMMLIVVWGMVALQPHVVSADVTETPSRVRIAVDLSSSMDVIDLQRTPQEQAELLRALKLPGAGVDLSRRQVAARVLGRDGMNLAERLGAKHQVELIGFHDRALAIEPQQVAIKLVNVGAKDVRATDLQHALTNTMADRANPLLGIIVLTDGMHNVGPAPFGRAEQLGKQRTPIFPVVIGSHEPPSDLLIVDVNAPTKVFKKGTLPIEVRCKVTNMPAQKIDVELQFDGKPVESEHRQSIEHKGGDEVYTVRLQARMEDVGTFAYLIKATSKSKEITLANNAASRVVRVAEDKAKVLLIDGEARWEYHYLAVALARDPAIELERVVFAQPRIGGVKEADLDKVGRAKTKLPEPAPDRKDLDPLLAFDCIILGDVAPEQLPIEARRRLEKFVAERGGTLVMVAGKRHVPMDYVKTPDDPLAKMLPITEPKLLEKESGFTLRVTGEGKLQSFLQLDPSAAEGWPELPKHFWGVAGKRKPAASILLAPIHSPLAPPGERGGGEGGGDKEETGLLVQQNYGFGRVLFLGIDSSWRWRFRVGDTYHHRFWGQLTRWAAAEKLLPAGNKFLRYGPREPAYHEGQDAEFAVRLNESLPPLKDPSQAKIKIIRQRDDGKEELVAVAPLARHARQPNLLEAKTRDLAAGVYRVELDIAEFREQIAVPSEDADAQKKGRDAVRILARVNEEMLDLSTNWSLLQSLADRSDGKVYTPGTVEEILERLSRKVERKEERTESRPWQDEPMVWWVLGILLGLLCVEWTWRKIVDLA
jgi:hypothetical protein